MSTVKDGDTVKIGYVITDPDGKLISQNEKEKPVSFTVGDQSILPGINKLLIGMSVGEVKSKSVSPKDAFGDINDELVIRHPLESLPENIKIGDTLAENNNPNMQWRVRELHDEFAILDANHPYAGVDINIGVELFAISAD